MMEGMTFPAECQEDRVLIPWLAEYLRDRDRIIYDDGYELSLSRDCAFCIPDLNDEYRQQFEAHGLWLATTPTDGSVLMPWSPSICSTGTRSCTTMDTICVSVASSVAASQAECRIPRAIRGAWALACHHAHCW
jgi:hypothetical protein